MSDEAGCSYSWDMTENEAQQDDIDLEPYQEAPANNGDSSHCMRALLANIDMQPAEGATEEITAIFGDAMELTKFQEYFIKNCCRICLGKLDHNAAPLARLDVRRNFMYFNEAKVYKRGIPWMVCYRCIYDMDNRRELINHFKRVYKCSEKRRKLRDNFCKGIPDPVVQSGSSVHDKVITETHGEKSQENARIENSNGNDIENNMENIIENNIENNNENIIENNIENEDSGENQIVEESAIASTSEDARKRDAEAARIAAITHGGKAQKTGEVQDEMET